MRIRSHDHTQLQGKLGSVVHESHHVPRQMAITRGKKRMSLGAHWEICHIWELWDTELSLRQNEVLSLEPLAQAWREVEAGKW